LVVEARDISEELGQSCLWDCSRTLLATGGYGEIIVSVVRTGDPDKANRTLDSLKREFASQVEYEYPAGEFETLSRLASNAWVVELQRGVDHDSVAGASRGVVVIWVVYSYDICGERDGLVYCEGDKLYLSSVAARVAEMQLESLMAAGY